MVLLMKKSSVFRKGLGIFLSMTMVLSLCTPSFAAQPNTGTQEEFYVDNSKGAYKTGHEFGAEFKDEIQQNINELFAAAPEDFDKVKVLEETKQTAKLYEELIPEKLEWIKGVSDASGISYDDLLIFNFSDKVIGGEYGECTTFMAQGSAVAGGGTVIAKNRDQSINTLSEVAVKESAKHAEGDKYKAATIEIPEVSETYKFVGSRTAGRWGYGMGINEYQVIASDNDGNSRDYMEFEAGLHDNDVIRLILERAKTAREGVTVVARLVEEYGQSWNGIMFEIGDPDELWIVEVAGKRWAAKCYKDTVTARSNQFQLEADYDISSADLYSFAKEMGWTDAAEGEKISFRGTYATDILYPKSNDNIKQRPSVEKLYNTEMRYQRAMELLNTAVGNGPISIKQFMAMNRDHFDTYTLPSGKVIDMKQVPFYSSDIVNWYDREWKTEFPTEDTTQEPLYVRGACSHDLGWGATSTTGIMHVKKDQPNGLGLMLHSFMPPCMGTFVPFYVGIDKVDDRFSTPRAAELFNTISTKAFGFYTMYHDPARAALDPYENAMLSSLPEVEAKYTELINAGNVEEATKYLTDFVTEQSNAAYTAAEKALENMNQAAVDASKW